MGFFSSILEKLGLKSGEAQPAAAPPAAATQAAPAPAAPPAPVAIAVVEVVAQSEKLAAARFFFKRLAANGQVVGTSQSHASESTRSTGIASVKGQRSFG